MAKVIACSQCGSTKILNHGGKRRKCSACGYTFRIGNALQVEETGVQKAKGNRFLITTAISGCRVDLPFWETLHKMAEHIGAQVLVVPVPYHNPTSRFENVGTTYDERITPYAAGYRLVLPSGVETLVGARIALSRRLVLAADVPIQPTAARPLSSMHTYVAPASGIFGHTKMAMESIATPHGMPPQFTYTTGACTVPMYSRSKAGKKGEHHHVCGALVVEIDGDNFWVRQVRGDKRGSITDAETTYCRDGSKATGPIETLTLGDLHVVRRDESNWAAMLDMLQVLKPRAVMLHDPLDFQSQSHHNTYLEDFKLTMMGKANVLDEVCETVDRIAELIAATEGTTFYMIPSNHNEHFRRWLEGPAPRKDHQNAWIYHHTLAAMLEQVRAGLAADPFAYWFARLRPLLTNRVRFVQRGESLMFKNIEHGEHGDKGPNGSRGSRAAIARAGAKYTIGHGHGAGIHDGVYQAGTSSQLFMGYNTGPSDWSHSHVLLYESGRRAIVTVSDGCWRLK